VNAIDARFRTVTGPGGRAVAGLSEGGFGAINIALHHPHEFSVVESWSGYERPDPLRSIYGPSLQLLARNDPLANLPRLAPQLRGAYFWLYSGSRDRLRAQNAVFAEELARGGVAHRYFLSYGGHNWALWRKNARAAYLAAAAHLSSA
jgi:S-formylglutathione hydrolase FrmB